MQGISTEHQILTDSGWKYIHEIDIDKDRLYTLEFEKEEYCHSHYPKTKFIKPLKKNYYENYEEEMYHINSINIDLLMTKDYLLPVNTPNQGCSYSGSAGLFHIDTIIKILKDSDKLKFGEKNEIMFYSEKDKLSLKEYQKDNAVYYQFNITISNIKKIKPNGVSIFNFTMPESINKDINYRIYVKNDDKKYWV